MNKIINPQLLNIHRTHQKTAPLGTKNTGQNFNSILKNQLDTIKVSKHAMQRIENRGISVDEATLEKLNIAMDKLSQKGSKDSLILLDEIAYIVNPQKRVVITAVDQHSLKDNVFTGIDSAIII